MDAMGIKTVLLFTDSQGAIDEAMRCVRVYACGVCVFVSSWGRVCV